MVHLSGSFLGSTTALAPQNGAKTVMAATKIVRKAQKAANSATRTYKKFDGDALWLPNTQRPAWLDGSLPGDRGFDPLELSKPSEFLQVDLDQSDINKSVNKAGGIVGKYSSSKVQATGAALSPYSEVFGLQRFRETELIHGRWAMLGALGVVIAEATTGVSWVDAGKVELDGTQYLGFSLPFSISQLIWIEVLLVGGAEIYRNRSTDLQERIYPGGLFDPLKLASDDSQRTFKLREAEIKHGRLAMVAFLGAQLQSRQSLYERSQWP
ncbi:chlorophyll a/b-binding protein CP29 [Coccomyxa subellipsoidea C-169]|uniref:Chlorophyll a-b binding protein, chloroplastic n=1 Tax=Coccomyxa subellipsoidea (strain C-169) TaxID=574566 RepID=I0YTG2_COCSC|nr:chlorophyll a/b-binding protein CP29 [Coccomyxa subellipsoidea C-169]EIE21681.1 chlorophyll a/b-binding protein CP29 [Coccomyxa subellipsoidea C-169]|eukprot:XP_005646225.1 chlorophyll a/b-binding protein CP29 [Coccomyxa subellipsoidea C-169]